MSTAESGARFNIMARYQKKAPARSSIDNYSLCSDSGANLQQSFSTKPEAGALSGNDNKKIKISVSNHDQRENLARKLKREPPVREYFQNVGSRISQFNISVGTLGIILICLSLIVFCNSYMQSKSN